MSLKTLPALNDGCLHADLSPSAEYAMFTEAHFHATPWKEWIMLTQTLPKCHPTKGPWIAGGAVRRMLLKTGTTAADIDYFCLDKQQFDILCARLESKDAHLTEETRGHMTYKMPDETIIQAVRSRYKDTLEKHMNEFDFNLCQTGWDGEKFLVSVQAWKDLQSNTISLTGTQHSPMSSWIRIAKYQSQGFTASHDTLQSLLEIIGDTKIASYSGNL